MFNRYRYPKTILMALALIACTQAAHAQMPDGDSNLADQEKPLTLKTEPLSADKQVTPKDTTETIAPMMDPLPVAPEQMEQGKSQGQSVQGQAQVNVMSGASRVIKANPMTRYRGPRLTFVELRVRNNGSEPVVLRGEECRAITSSGTITALPDEQIVQFDNSIISPGDKIAVAAVSAASVGLAGPIFYEIITPKEHRKRNLGVAIGRDAGRHEIEAQRLSRRVVLPQDETVGWLAFPAEKAQAGITAINLPLLISPVANVSGNITIPVQ